MMERSEIESRVNRIVTEHLNCDPTRVLPAADIAEDLDADSLDFVELVMAMEEEFDIAISDEEAEKICTVGDFATVVEACLGR